MSDSSQGPGWWLASDNKWYAPELRPATPAAIETVPRAHPIGYRTGGSHRKRMLVVLGSSGLAVILAVSLFLALGSGPSNGLAGKSANEVLAATMIGARQRGSVHMLESDKPSGGGTYDVGANEGRQTISDGNEGNATLLVLPGMAYLKGDAAFLQNQLGTSIASASRYAQQWISFQPSYANYAALVEGDTLASALTEATPVGHLSLTSVMTIDGQNVVGVSGGVPADVLPASAKGSEVLYVSTVAPYLPVELAVSGTYNGQSADSTLTFSDWGERISVVAPSGATPSSALSSSST
jgi:hypothetical protein